MVRPAIVRDDGLGRLGSERDGDLLGDGRGVDADATLLEVGASEARSGWSSAGEVGTGRALRGQKGEGES